MEGVNAILIFESKILMMLRDDKPGIANPGGWGVIGGGVEEGETPDQAIVREVKEETNIDLVRYHKWFEIPEVHQTIYWAKLTSMQVSQIKIGEGQRLEFISVDEIENLPTSEINHQYFMKFKPKFKELIEQLASENEKIGGENFEDPV